MKRRILLISLGSIGRRHLRNVKELMPGADLCIWRHKHGDIPADAKNIPIVYSEEDALTFTPDAVIVSSPASFHADQCAPFAVQGLPIFVEKPLEVSVAAVAKLTTALEAGKGLLFVGYVLRFQPIMVALKSILDSQKIGVVRTAHIATGQYLPDWRPDSDYRDGVSAQASLGGGVLLELSHELDYAHWFFGQPQTITAEAGKLSDLDIDVEDSATVIFGYPKARVTINIDFLQRVAAMTLKVVGSEATLEADLVAETASIRTPYGIHDLDLPKLTEGNEMYLRQFDAFFTQAFAEYAPVFEESNDSAFARFEDALAVVKLVEAAKQSAAAGKRVNV
ncbi:MAG: Gfo/Idh/MocA family oxidoreductase [Pseudomonadota bacterium]